MARRVVHYLSSPLTPCLSLSLLIPLPSLILGVQPPCCSCALTPEACFHMEVPALPLTSAWRSCPRNLPDELSHSFSLYILPFQWVPPCPPCLILKFAPSPIFQHSRSPLTCTVLGVFCPHGTYYLLTYCVIYICYVYYPPPPNTHTGIFVYFVHKYISNAQNSASHMVGRHYIYVCVCVCF